MYGLHREMLTNMLWHRTWQYGVFFVNILIEGTVSINADGTTIEF